MIYDYIVQLVGEVPYGFEPVIYVVACVILVWLLSTFFSVLWSFFTMIGGGRNK